MWRGPSPRLRLRGFEERRGGGADFRHLQHARRRRCPLGYIPSPPFLASDFERPGESTGEGVALAREYAG